MKIFIASDHAGFDLKQHLISYLEENGLEVVDCGPEVKTPGDDYPDWISKAAAEISKNPNTDRGIVIGLSGQGEAMVANRFPDVRAGVFYGGPEEIVQLLREHNDANVISLGAKFLSNEEAEKVVNTWIETQFSNDPRHIRRIGKIHILDVKR